MKLYFVTSNGNKFREAKSILSVDILQLNLKIEEIQALDVETVVKDKAIKAYKSARKAVVVEDTGLYIKKLNGFPGALIKWVLGTVGNQGICNMVTGKNRDAYAETVVCLYDGKKAITFKGRINGIITRNPVGKKNFGWDPIFRPKGYSLTFAQMAPAEKDKISMRRIAFKKLERYLSTHKL